MNKNMILIAVKSAIQLRCCDNIKLVEGFDLKYGEHNGIIGSGSFTPSHMVSKYFCENCGQVFQSTDSNKLDDGREKREELAGKILHNTRVVRLKKDLNQNEIFHDNKENSRLNDEKALSSFVKDSVIRCYVDRNSGNSSMLVHEDPQKSSGWFIVSGEKFPKLVWWDKYVRTERFLLKKEKKEIEEKYNAMQKVNAGGKIQMISRTLEFEYEGRNSTKIIGSKLSKPLPIGSERAEKIFHPVLIKDFYVPLSAIS